MSDVGRALGSGDAELDARDREGRARAVDPRFNVALEASAGTGKTRVLVDRYVNLLKAGVDPANVLAVTFTRKAAAEMRERIVATLRRVAATGEITPGHWRTLRDRLGEISVSTIDAFCLSLLREFPLEADLDPAFTLADETDVPRLVDESLDRALLTCRGLARSDEAVALVFAQLGDARVRRGLGILLRRRLVAGEALERVAMRTPSGLTLSAVVARTGRALIDLCEQMRGGLDGFASTGPLHPGFFLLTRDLAALRTTLDEGAAVQATDVRRSLTRLRAYCLTKKGEPRRRQLLYPKALFRHEANYQMHQGIVAEHGSAVVRLSRDFDHALHQLMARGTRRIYAIAETEYRRTLDAQALVDFTDILQKAVGLLRQMEEFSQSRFRLESRYHHVLVDEFQDTSRAQWELLSLLVQAWGAGVGAAFEGPLPPSIFIVGDRKQSIYRFRDADVSLLRHASRYLEGLRPDGDVARSISRSFRATPPLLAFVNDVCRDVEKVDRPDAFGYDDHDRFPVDPSPETSSAPLGLVTAPTLSACAELVADEIVRMLESGTIVRDRDSGLHRSVRPSDIAILLRARDDHRAFEGALQRRGVPTQVYKGLGFFEAEEVQDVCALLRYLAEPHADLRAAALLRSRLVRISDDGLSALAPHLADALRSGPPAAVRVRLTADDASVLDRARDWVSRWLALADVVPAAELLDLALHESGYAVEQAGRRVSQGHENLKKIRAIVRRLQNRGYLTLQRLSSHLERLASADEANAAVDAQNAVHLMTVHASKGLEFPVVFVANLTRGTASQKDPIRIYVDEGAEDDVTVAVGDVSAEADERALAGEREETKRLLYVALTRARDRLYLSAVLPDGRWSAGRGSFAEVIPATLAATLASPMGAPTTWASSLGQTHVLTRVDAPAATLEGSRSLDVEAPSVQPVDRELLAGTPRTVRQSPTEVHDPPSEGARVRVGSDRLAGVIVHRVIQRRGLVRLSAGEAGEREALSVLGRDERGELTQPEMVISIVRRALDDLCERDDVRDLLDRGRSFHEVPFSLLQSDGIVRGTIDCVVALDDGRVVVLEFKTGRPRPEHEQQLALYRQAMTAVFPEADVQSMLVYASSGPASP